MIILRIILILAFIFTSILHSQTMESFSVEWIRSYSTERDFGKKENFFDKVKNFVFGKDEINLMAPFNVAKLNNGKFLVFDQGHNKPLICSKEGIQIIEKSDTNYFGSLVDFTFINSNQLLFTDSESNNIYLYDSEENSISRFPTNVELMQPTGIVFLPEKEQIVVSETRKHRLALLDKNGNFLMGIGFRGEDSTTFNYPTDLTRDKDGNIYLIDALNYKIKIFDKNLNFLFSFGEAGDATGYFSRPKGIGVDSFGHIYVSDALFHVVQIFDNQGNYLFTFGGKGREDGNFWMPCGIFIDENNHIYIADKYNSRIQEYRLLYGR